MRIHTSATSQQIMRALDGLTGVSAEVLTEHKSTTHARAFELALSGHGVRGGGFSRGNFRGATWDEWGTVMARIFAVDPLARMGGTVQRPVYVDADDFHWKTGDRFLAKTMPFDAHARHSWGWSGDSIGGTYSVRECRKCTALSRMRWMY
jgi:hypothetical protein